MCVPFVCIILKVKLHCIEKLRFILFDNFFFFGNCVLFFSIQGQSLVVFFCSLFTHLFCISVLMIIHRKHTSSMGTHALMLEFVLLSIAFCKSFVHKKLVLFFCAYICTFIFCKCLCNIFVSIEFVDKWHRFCFVAVLCNVFISFFLLLIQIKVQ